MALYDVGLAGGEAEKIAFDNSVSGMYSDNVQGAIDELKGTIGYSKKNLIPYPYNGSTYSNYGIDWTTSDDGVISANGTNTNSSEEVFHVTSRTENPLTLKKGKYILNGCADSGSEETYKIIVSKTLSDGSGEIIATDYGNGCEFTLNEDSKIGVYIYIMPNSTVNVEFKPMIRYASIDDDTYEPYVFSIEDMLYFKTGETVTISDVVICAGVVAGSGNIYFTVPLIKNLKYISTISMTCTKLFIRSMSDEIVFTDMSNLRFEYYPASNLLTIMMKNIEGFNITAGTPVSIAGIFNFTFY